jgi:hypothetical protein
MHDAALQRALIFAAVLADVAPVAVCLEHLDRCGELDEERYERLNDIIPEAAQRMTALLGRLTAIRQLRYDYLRADPWGYAATIVVGEGLSIYGTITRRK